LVLMQGCAEQRSTCFCTRFIVGAVALLSAKFEDDDDDDVVSDIWGAMHYRVIVNKNCAVEERVLNLGPRPQTSYPKPQSPLPQPPTLKSKHHDCGDRMSFKHEAQPPKHNATDAQDRCTCAAIYCPSFCSRRSRTFKTITQTHRRGDHAQRTTHSTQHTTHNHDSIVQPRRTQLARCSSSSSSLLT